MRVLLALLLMCSTAVADEVRIQVLIKEQTAYGEYNDALYYSLEDYATIEPEQIVADRQARVDAWVYLMEHPPEVNPNEIPPEPEEPPQ